ncbi:MAG: helix-turn-helix domain-containing protein [Anaerolineales bacterium]|nr:helix-turn-helix domain-containing protein [Anaerolineales bacterium]
MTKIFKLDNVLTSPEKFVLLSLADHGNDDGMSIYPSISLTASRTSLSERSVRRIQNTLEAKGFLTKSSTGGGHLTNTYQIDVAFIDQILTGQKPLPLTESPPSLDNNSPSTSKKGCNFDAKSTPDRESPLTESHGSDKYFDDTPDRESSLPGLSVPPPLTESPPCPDTESAESLVNHKRIININHEEEEEVISENPPSSSPEIDWGSKLPAPGSPLEADQHPVIQLFKTITGRIPGIKDYSLAIDTLRLLRRRFGCDQELVKYLVPFWDDWQKRKARSGYSYRRSSLVWLTEWAVNNDIPGKGSPHPKPKNYKFPGFLEASPAESDEPEEPEEPKEPKPPPTFEEEILQKVLNYRSDQWSFNPCGNHLQLEKRLKGCRLEIDDDHSRVIFHAEDEYSAKLLESRLDKTLERDLTGIFFGHFGKICPVSVTFVCDEQALGVQP